MTRSQPNTTASAEQVDTDSAAGGTGGFGHWPDVGRVDAPTSLPTPSRGEGGMWLATAVGLASLVVAAYVLTHTHPAYEGGLFVEMVESIRAGGWTLPDRIVGYTAPGVPFAYPPLLFYAVAAVVELTGADPVALELYVPGLVTIAYLFPYWLVARELLPSRRQAGLATVLYAVTPDALQWHVSAGGIVRAPAMFLTLLGIYTGVRLFREGGLRWLAASTVLFGLVVLAHPVYAAFFGMSYLLLFVGLDRSMEGLTRGAVVAAGGIAAAAPWWLTVIGRHGADIFMGVTNTRSSLGGGSSRLAQQFGAPIVAADPITPFYVAAFAGGIYAAVRRRFLLPAWMVIASYGLGEDRFTFVAGSMLSAMLVFEFVLPWVEDLVERFDARGRIEVRRAAVVGLLALVVLGAGSVGAAYAGSQLDTAYDHSTTMPQTVDAEDRAAMAWVANNTTTDAEFAVVGDSAEWFPHYADRTILLSPWGTEWTSPEEFQLHLERYEELSACDSATCVEWTLRGVPGDAEYVYVPKGEYTIRGQEQEPPEELIESLADAERFDRVYENEDVVIFEVERSEGSSAASGRITGRLT